MFVGINVAFSPLTMMLFWGMLIAVGVGGAPLIQQWLAALVVIVIIPGLLAGGLATLIEFALRRLGRPDRAKRWGWRSLVVAVAFVSPCAFLPVMFFSTVDRLGGTEEEREAARQRAARPIVEIDSMGFCSVPTFTIHDGRPELSIAVRVRERGTYALTAMASFARRELPSEHGTAWSEEGLTGSTVRELDPGVDTMTVRLEGGKSNNTPLEWPVRITHLDLAGPGGRSIDYRGGDSLSVIDSTGLPEHDP